MQQLNRKQDTHITEAPKAVFIHVHISIYIYTYTQTYIYIDDDDDYLDKIQTKGVKKSILYM
jgi:hypothetical protein